MTTLRKNLLSGLFFVGVGIVYGVMTIQTLPIGTALNMGPGYFPIVLCGLLILFGLVTIVQGVVANGVSPPLRPVPWRAIVMVLTSLMFFAFALQPLGLFPTVFGTALLATAAGHRVGPLSMIAISFGIALFCSLLFGFGLQLPIPVFNFQFLR